MRPLTRTLRFLKRKRNQLLELYYASHDPVKLVKIRYREKLGCEPDLDNPQTMNEKILWMCLFGDTAQWPLLADKYRVREYVEECGFGDMLNELYGVWESPEDIDFEKLPLPCIIKTNNGNGHAVVIRDKKDIDPKRIRRKLRHALKRKFGRMSGEYHYFAIPPRIIAEKYLPFDPALGEHIIDYKIHCFDGEPRWCVVCYGSMLGDGMKIGVFDVTNWEYHPEYTTPSVHHDTSMKRIPRPRSFDRMLEAARRFSAGHPQTRIDFYEVDGRAIFGEITMSASAGVARSFTSEFQHKTGAMITLPECKQRF